MEKIIPAANLIQAQESLRALRVGEQIEAFNKLVEKHKSIVDKREFSVALSKVSLIKDLITSAGYTITKAHNNPMDAQEVTISW